MLHALSLGSIALCLLLWQRAKTVDQDGRGNAERRALFVGLWPPRSADRRLGRALRAASPPFVALNGLCHRSTPRGRAGE
jgi:hypothetical protein